MIKMSSLTFFGQAFPIEVLYIFALFGVLIIFIYILSGIRIIKEWERAPVLRLGRYLGLKGPGVIWILPGIDKIPSTALLGDRDYGIRFYGVPAGYEFTSLIEDIIDVSKRDAGLPEELLNELSKVDKPVHIQILISPTWPYCARAVRTAHRFAMANEHITADMIELTEFPHIAVKHNVQTVPKVVINEEHSLTGSVPDNEFIQAILKAIGK